MAPLIPNGTERRLNLETRVVGRASSTPNLIVPSGLQPQGDMPPARPELRCRDVVTRAGRGVVYGNPVDGLGRVVLGSAHPAVGEAGRYTLDVYDHAIRSRVLDLDAFQLLFAADDQVEVPVL